LLLTIFLEFHLLHLYTILPQETEKFILRFPEVVGHPPEGEGVVFNDKTTNAQSPLPLGEGR
jgi:hypothetical protein